MADDVNPDLRAELESAKGILEPQIRGLQDLTHVSISGDLRDQITNQIGIRQRRLDRINSVLGFLNSAVEALDLLERDGYPDIEDSKLPDSLFKELTGEESDLEAALKIFGPDTAQNLSINLGDSAAKKP